MPHLRFTRDPRGYEHTLLVDVVRRRGREQSRVLYFFRTPPQVKVGRAAIDEDAIRALEEAYPAVTFDWNRILEARPPEPDVGIEDPRRRPRGKGLRERDARRERPERPPARREPPPAIPGPSPMDEGSALAGPDAADQETTVMPDPVLESEAGEAAAAPLSALADVAVAAAELNADADELDADGEPPAPAAHATEPSAAERLLGSEGLLRLRARHAEVCARIAAQVSDPQRQEALRTLAERLNPDGWVTEPDVRDGLEQFEQVLDQVRREVGPLRKRTRRGGRRNRRRHENRALPSAAPPEQEGSATEEPADSHPEDDEG